MSYKFITTRKGTSDILNGIPAMNAEDVWQKISNTTDHRATRLLEGDNCFALYHYFPEFQLCCVEYMAADTPETARELMGEIQRRIHNQYTAGTYYFHMEAGGISAGISAKKLHMYRMWGNEDYEVSSNYAKVETIRVIQLLYMMHKHVYGVEDPWTWTSFKRAIEELILGARYLPRIKDEEGVTEQ